MLTPEELQRFRQTLLMLQARIQGDVEQVEEEAFSTSEGSDHGSPNHLAELGSDAWEVDFSMRIVENDEMLLTEIAEAINRIDSGTFGLCQMCLESGVEEKKAAIPKSRLKAIPYARNCIDCERRREQRNADT